tara:strand:+ start:589 stop:744 length:156 start_codon:yes stop_codon:yes gene_type:complete
MIGISPMEFWELSPTEVYSAIKGWREFNTSEPEEGPMTRDELTELMELYPD